MKPGLSSSLKHLFLCLIVLILTACDSGGSKDKQSTETVNVERGEFIASFVAGLRYEAESTGEDANVETNEFGEFQYAELGGSPQNVSFFLGGVPLGSVAGKRYITPLDLFSAFSTSDQRVLNLLRLLQTLDSNGNPDDGIVISQQAQDLFAPLATLDFNSDILDGREPLVSIFDELGIDQEDIVSAEDAQQHFISALDNWPEFDLEFYQLNGQANGLIGSVELSLGATSLTVQDNGSFAFLAAFLDGGNYSVSISSVQGEQSCSLIGATGFIDSADVTDIVLQCSQIAPNEYFVGGSVSGLGGELVITNNIADSLSLTSNGDFTFSNPIANLSNYSVQITQQPLGQTCELAGAVGVVDGADVQSIAINCIDDPTPRFFVGGSISNLSGTIDLSLNGNSSLRFSGTGFTFPAGLEDDDAYIVSIVNQPSGQTCSLANASGTIAANDVNNVEVSCTFDQYSLGGSVTGLSGLVVLADGGNEVSISENGPYTLASDYLSGSDYDVTVSSSPEGQDCQISNASGEFDASNIENVNVTCSDLPRFSVGGSITGLSGTISIANGVDTDSISTNGPYAISTGLLSGTDFNVQITQQPVGQVCQIAGNIGTIADADVTTAVITCDDIPPSLFTVGGTISGLTGSVELSLNGGDAVTFSGTVFTFSGGLASGEAYNVALVSDPDGLACVVANETGTIDGANVSNVTVTCERDQFTLGGNVSGLSGNLVLNNGSDQELVTQNGDYTFDEVYGTGSAYNVEVLTQPEGQTCVVSNATGTIVSLDVLNANVACSTNEYAISGAVSGHTGTVEVTLTVGSTDTVRTIAAGSSGFSFGDFEHGTTYSAAVTESPLGQSCVLSSTSGTLTEAVSLNVTCSDLPRFSVGGTVSGLVGSIQLSNGTDTPTIIENGSYTITTGLLSGSSYDVNIETQPVGQVCSITNDQGSVAGANVTNVNVSCSTNQYAISGSVQGHTDTVTLTLFINDVESGNETLPPGTTAFNFGNFDHGTAYRVEVTGEPSAQNCPITNSQGELTAAVMVAVNCTNAPTFSIGGSIADLTGAVVLVNNGSDQRSLSTNGPYSFSGELLTGESYAVTVLTQPEGQECRVANGTGTVGTSDIGDVNVSCLTNTYGIGGSVSGQTDTITVSLTIDGNAPLTSELPVGAVAFDFGTFDHGTLYELSTTSPFGQTCSINNAGDGTLTGVINATVSCTDLPRYTVTGDLQELARGSIGLMLSQNGNEVEPLTLSADGEITFTTQFLAGDTYSVAITSTPDTQTCSIDSGASGTISGDVTSLLVDCDDVALHTITTRILDLEAGDTISVSINGGDPLTAIPSSVFTTDIFEGQSYSVSVTNIPSKYDSCTTTPASINPVMGPQTVTIDCDLEEYSVSGTVSGIVGNDAVLISLAGASTSSFTASSNVFALTLEHGTQFTASTTDPDYACVVVGGEFEVTAADSSVEVSCQKQNFNIQGSVSIPGPESVSLAFTGQASQSYTNNDSFSFTVGLGSSFNVSDTSNQYACSLAGGAITDISSDVSGLNIVCELATFDVSGSVSGLESYAGISLRLSTGGGSTNISPDPATGQFSFSDAVLFNDTYDLTIASGSPAGFECPDPATSPQVQADVTGASIVCTPLTFDVFVTVTNLQRYGSVNIEVSDGPTITVENQGVAATRNQRLFEGTYDPNTTTLSILSSSGRDCDFANGQKTIDITLTQNQTLDVSCAAPVAFAGGYFPSQDWDSDASAAQNLLNEDAAMLGRVQSYVAANGIDDFLDVGSMDVGCLAYTATVGRILGYLGQQADAFAYASASDVAPEDLLYQCVADPYQVEMDITIDDSVTRYYPSATASTIYSATFPDVDSTTGFILGGSSDSANVDMTVRLPFVRCDVSSSTGTIGITDGNSPRFFSYRFNHLNFSASNNTVRVPGTCYIDENTFSLGIELPDSFLAGSTSQLDATVRGFTGLSYRWTSSCFGSSFENSRVESPSFYPGSSSGSCQITFNAQRSSGFNFSTTETVPVISDNYEFSGSYINERNFRATADDISGVTSAMEEFEDAITADHNLASSYSLDDSQIGELGCLAYTQTFVSLVSDIAQYLNDSNLVLEESDIQESGCTIANPYDADFVYSFPSNWSSYFPSVSTSGFSRFETATGSNPATHSVARISRHVSCDGLDYDDTNRTLTSSLSNGSNGYPRDFRRDIDCEILFDVNDLEDTTRYWGQADNFGLSTAGDRFDLDYSWSDNCGGQFSSTSSSNPTWTAPSSDSQCSVTVRITSDFEGDPLNYSDTFNVDVSRVNPAFDLSVWTSFRTGVKELEFNWDVGGFDDTWRFNSRYDIVMINGVTGEESVIHRESAPGNGGNTQHVASLPLHILPDVEFRVDAYVFGRFQFSSPSIAADTFYLNSSTGYFKAPLSDPSDVFGANVTLSGDGLVMAVAAHGDDSTGLTGSFVYNNSGSSVGAVYVYRRPMLSNGNYGSWSLDGYLKPPVIDSDSFGNSAIAINEDGSVIAVGVQYDDSPSALELSLNTVENSGAVFIYRMPEDGFTWEYAQAIKAPVPQVSSYFGDAIDLSADGNTLVLGHGFEDFEFTNQGRVHIYRYDSISDSFEPFQVLESPTPSSFNYFGGEVAISDDGNRIVVAAQYESFFENGIFASIVGAAYVFDIGLESLYEFSSKLNITNPTDYPDSAFGEEGLAMSGDGNVVALGSRRFNETESRGGAVAIFRESGDIWRQSELLTSPEVTENANYGEHVELNYDGSILAVSSPGDMRPQLGIFEALELGQTSETVSSGSVYIYQSGANSVYQLSSYIKELHRTLGTSSRFGYWNGVSLDASGYTLAVGNITDNNAADGDESGETPVINDLSAGMSSGAVYLY